MIRKVGILTSGGDSPGMNAAIRSITRVALASGIEVVGIYDGYKGLLKEKFKQFNHSDVSDILSRGGTILGSARLKEFKDENVQKEAAEILKKNKIDALIVIGGDGSYRGALALSKLGINCIGLPGTIDNDIPGSELTIGFDTALNTAVSCIDKLRDTSSSHHRCSIVEVMGNRCGDIALYSGLSCGAEIVITKETGYDEEEILDKLNYLSRLGKNHAIVIVSEKITDIEALARKISDKTGFSGRATVLGHIQRGGSPTPNDRILASRMGEKAIDLLIEGYSKECVIIKNGEIDHMPIDVALNETRKSRRNIFKLFDRLV